MIELKIEDYCNDCRAFEPEVKTSYSSDMTQTNKIICCEHARKCGIMMRYLVKQLERSQNADP